MARKINAFWIGFFALLCGALIVGSIIWIELSSYFENTKLYVSYFSESIKGLQKDAVVNYKGVPVGRVVNIGLAPDGRLVEVVMALKSDFRVDQTIAVQLREQGLTGLRYLEIDTAPKNIDQITPKITFQTRHPIIRSYPSEIEQLKFALQDIYEKFSSLNLQALTETWTKTAQLVNNLLLQFGAESETGDLRETISALKKTAQTSAALMDRISKAAPQKELNKGFQDLTTTLASLRQASDILAQQLKGMPPDVLKQLSSDLGATVKTGGTLLSSLQGKIDNSAVLLEQDLQQLRVLLIQLNSMIESLKEQPNRLIFPSKPQAEPFQKK